MAKKQATSTDQGMLEVANCDLKILTSDYIQNCIHIVRGEQVILDRDLARLYQVDTSQLNRQVKRNIERFPEDFMFQLTREEVDLVKSQFVTSKSILMGARNRQNSRMTNMADWLRT